MRRSPVNRSRNWAPPAFAVAAVPRHHGVPPGWVPLIVVSVIVLTVALLVFEWLSSKGSGGSGPDSPGGGGGVRPPDRPGPVGPAWWPEFERQFADYVAHAPGRSTATRDRPSRGTRAHGLRPRHPLRMTPIGGGTGMLTEPEPPAPNHPTEVRRTWRHS